jgi:hypothetical protein
MEKVRDGESMREKWNWVALLSKLTDIRCVLFINSGEAESNQNLIKNQSESS